MRIILTALVMLLLSSSAASARSCEALAAAEAELAKAERKQAVGDVLLKLGAPRDAVENLLRASPDTETARAEARRAIARLRARCEKSA